MLQNRTIAVTTVILGLALIPLACGDEESGTSTSAGDGTSDLEPVVDKGFAVGEDGHRLWIRSWGEGSPAIVFDTGFGPAGAVVSSGARPVDRYGNFARR